MSKIKHTLKTQNVVIPNMNDFIAAIKKRLKAAEKLGWSSLIIRSGPLHKELGAVHRMPMCCNAMRQLMQIGDRIIERPAKGDGARVTIEYRMPRTSVLEGTESNKLAKK